MLVQVTSPGVKTELCFFHSTPGGCKHGNMCAYAHGKDELRSPSVRFPSAVSLVDQPR
jgi:hypothetical protein